MIDSSRISLVVKVFVHKNYIKSTFIVDHIITILINKSKCILEQELYCAKSSIVFLIRRFLYSLG